jgi:biopolymer transport protein TolR
MGASLNGTKTRGSRTRQSISEINVTPFVDVMLVLLIIFMVTAPMLTVGVNVDLPDSAANPVEGQDEPLTITVNANGDVYLQETPITDIVNLITTLEAITQAKKDTRIFVRGDRQVDYGRVMQVMGAINAAGYNKVALITAPMQIKRGG